MNRIHQFLVLAIASFAVVSSTGCLFVPRSQLAAAEAQARQLAEQNRAQLSALDNLQNHSHELEDRLMNTESQLAAVDQKSRADSKRLAALEGELYDGHGNRLPPGLSKQLADLARRNGSLQFDPATGAAKLDTDVLFDSGEAELKEDAQDMLNEFVKIMRSPEARDLKLMVVGHTDALKIARRDVRERFPDNFHLASSRALAVADFLKKSGFPEQRIGVSGFAGHEAVASNETAEDRRRNRRVEIYVLPPEATIVGWTETATSLY
jgi:chemotaxis protein MotB